MNRVKLKNSHKFPKVVFGYMLSSNGMGDYKYQPMFKFMYKEIKCVGSYRFLFEEFIMLQLSWKI